MLLVAAAACVVLGLAGGSVRAAGSGTATDVPNPDSYACGQPTFVDFEQLADGYLLDTAPISTIQFTTPQWTVFDFAAEKYNGKYPNGEFTAQGTHGAWLPFFDVPGAKEGGLVHALNGNALSSGDDETNTGRIDFVNGASTFSLLTSEFGGVSLSAFTAGGHLIATATIATDNVGTGHMTELRVQDSTRDIAYVLVTGIPGS